MLINCVYVKYANQQKAKISFDANIFQVNCHSVKQVLISDDRMTSDR